MKQMSLPGFDPPAQEEPITIIELMDVASGEWIGYWAEGHPDPERFAAAVREQHQDEVDPADVDHVHCVEEPYNEDGERFRVVPADTPGARPITWWQL